MAVVSSVMLPLGSKAPDFNLPDVVSGKAISLASFSDKKFLLVMFICRHCPYVQHVKQELSLLSKDYQGRGVGIVAISANDAESYPDDAPDSLKEFAKEEGFTFPLCYDESQNVARAYKAACTPDFFLFNIERKLIYRGQLDETRPGSNKPATGWDLRKAIDNGLSRQPIGSDQKPSSGCSIKWKRTAS